MGVFLDDRPQSTTWNPRSGLTEKLRGENPSEAIRKAIYKGYILYLTYIYTPEN